MYILKMALLGAIIFVLAQLLCWGIKISCVGFVRVSTRSGGLPTIKGMAALFLFVLLAVCGGFAITQWIKPFIGL